MKAYPLLLLTLVGASLWPNYACAPVYAEVETPSTITITPTGLDSCEVVSNLNVQASYSLTNPDPSKLSTGDYLPNNSVATYSLEGLGGIDIIEVSFSAKTLVGNPSFYLDYYRNEDKRVRSITNFESLFGKQSDEYVDLTAPFEYPLADVEEFRFVITVTGVMNVQSLTITYEEGMDSFAKAMLSDLTCDASGVKPPSTEEWGAAKEAFEKLGPEEQGKYVNAVADAGGDVYERVTAKYDYILSKYGTEKYENFLWREVKETAALLISYADYGIATSTALILVAICFAVFLVTARKKTRVL